MAIAAAPEVPGFRALSQVSHGPASTIYSAQSTTLGRWVAVTVYSITLRDEQAQRRFRRGYEMSRRLGAHPHAVTVLEYGTTPQRQPYVVTELYEHGDLETLIQRQQQLTVGEVLRLGIAVAGALDTAHRAGVIHGGIHPARVLLAEDREPALADLGLVPLVDRSGPAALAGPMTYHAPPEVLEGEALDPATDVYSLASTLYTALTGRAPYAPETVEPGGPGDTTASLLLRILQHDIPAIDRRDVPPSLEKVLDQALSSEARHRPPRPLALVQALQSCQVELGLAPSQPVILDLPPTLDVVGPAEPSSPPPGWADLSLPPPPPLPEVRLPRISATLLPPSPGVASPEAAAPADTTLTITPSSASALAPAPAPADRAEAPPRAPEAHRPAVPAPGPSSSPPPPQVFVPYDPPEGGGSDDDQVAVVTRIDRALQPRTGSGIRPPEAAGVAAPPIGVAGTPTRATTGPTAPARPQVTARSTGTAPGQSPRRPTPVVADPLPRARALPVIVLAVLVAVIFAGVMWSIVTGDGTEDDRAQPGDAGINRNTGPDAADRGGLTAVESSVGLQLDWDGPADEAVVVLVLSTTEAPRTLPADTGTALVIPAAELSPEAGYCFAVVPAPSPLPPATELAADVPGEDLGPDACIRSGSVDTVRRS